MPAKLPKLPHVRFVQAKGKTYAYFDTGARKESGRPVYAAMPPLGSIGFYDAYASLKGARSKRQRVDYTVTHLVRDYERSKEFAEHAAKTKQVYGYTLRNIVKYLGEYPVNDLTRSDVQAILDTDIDGAGAHNMFLSVVSAIYSWARGREKTNLKPAEGIKRRKGGEHEPWPDHIVEAGVAATDANIRLAVRLLYFTGQRIGDMLKMRWSDIRDGVIEVTQQKTGKTVWVPLLDELREELDVTPKRGLTIVTEADGSSRSDIDVRAELKAFTLGLGAKTVPHGLRKNAVIAMLEAGCTVAETAAITGQTYKIVEHYAKRINQRSMAKAAIIKLENKRGKRKPERKLG